MRLATLGSGLLSAVTLLASCGNDATSNEYRAALATMQSIASPGETPSAEALGRAAAASIPGPVMVAVLRGGQAVAALVPFGTNAGHVTWSTAEKQTLTFRNGILTATRGLGDDLMSSEVSAAAQALSAGGGTGISRVARHLDGNDATVETVLTCVLSRDGSEAVTLVSGETVATSRFVERCRTSDGASVENLYWKDNGGTVRRSRQWVSATTGHIAVDVLRD